MPRDEEILKRRARFISAALLLAAGCKEEKTNVAPVPLNEQKSVAPPAPPKAPSRVPAPADRPKLTAKVTAAGEAKRAAEAAKIEAIHKSLFDLAGAIPAGCALGDATCRAQFKTFHDTLAKIRDDLYRLSRLGCPPKLADDIAIQEMVSSHFLWLTQWAYDIEKVAHQAADAAGDAGTAFNDLRIEADRAYAHPCLSFACP